MRTSFQDWKDKALVSIALQFDKEVIRITWSYVARRMAKSKRTGSELRLRLTSLKRTEALDLVEPEAASSNELEKAKAVVGSHAPTTEVAATAGVFETVLGWDEQDHVWWAST
ncbi:hypothetical protein PC116_g23917 [Phytophthora cactorum]|nr:hypothetical protein PC122_g19894 [Phytophthora cactorum]KAG3154069.1 hypothetical protein PC128_g22449 [Phytophthora cactorum]KAG4043106.1 hypothetical protein PC123_g21426 [Phytophthora cactorum]KAG4227706.1 hypothetical protein PC116_g23917 [Phytophthora cactorum]